MDELPAECKILYIGRQQILGAFMSKISSVVSACFHLDKSNPPQLAVSAAGQVSSSGWKDGVLTPMVYVMPPQDGLQDFTFEATPPTEMALDIMLPISGDGSLAFEPWMKGVRVNAAGNSVEVSFEDTACAVGKKVFEAPAAEPVDGPKHPTLPGGNGGR